MLERHYLLTQSIVWWFMFSIFTRIKVFLQYINLVMLTYQRENFLQVCFDPYRGLKLCWHFKDIGASQNYFRHIFVISSQKQNQTFYILDSLYKKMKYGDLFCCIYVHDTYIYRVGRWIEKTQLTKFKAQRHLKDKSKLCLQQHLKMKLVHGARKEAQQFNEPVIINFIGIQKSQVDFYKNQIMRHRFSLKHDFQYIVNLFGNFQQNKISVHTGINQFKTDLPNFEDYAEYYHKAINSATIQTAKIQITAIHGQLSLFNQKYWRNADFNRIYATYYGPSSSYEFDNIYFHNRDPNVDGQHEFQLKLQIKLFHNKVLESTKRFKINFFREKQYFPTFHKLGLNTYFPQKNICLSQNPNKCEVIVKYEPSKRCGLII